jgi:hypothetical protein
MSTREPYLHNVSRGLAVVREAPFKITKALFLALAALCTLGGVTLLRLGRRLVTRHRPFLYSFFVVFFRGAIPQVHLESGAALVKRDGVPEVPDVAIGFGEGESAREDAHRAYGVPAE